MAHELSGGEAQVSLSSWPSCWVTPSCPAILALSPKEGFLEGSAVEAADHILGEAVRIQKPSQAEGGNYETLGSRPRTTSWLGAGAEGAEGLGPLTTGLSPQVPPPPPRPACCSTAPSLTSSGWPMCQAWGQGLASRAALEVGHPSPHLPLAARHSGAPDAAFQPKATARPQVLTPAPPIADNHWQRQSGPPTLWDPHLVGPLSSRRVVFCSGEVWFLCPSQGFTPEAPE